MRHLESILVFSFLIGMILIGGQVLKDLNSTDIKGQVKAIVEYNQGIRK